MFVKPSPGKSVGSNEIAATSRTHLRYNHIYTLLEAKEAHSKNCKRYRGCTITMKQLQIR